MTPRHTAVGDLAVTGGQIVAVGSFSGHGETEIDARNLTAIPGVIDSQVHFREPGLEHKEDLESGTRSALMGGVTSILEMPNTAPNTTDEASLADKLRRASGRAWTNYGFFVGASNENVESLPALEKLPGTPGVKIFMGSSTGSLLVSEDDVLSQILAKITRRCSIHAEDEARNVWRKAHLGPTTDPIDHPYLRDEESASLATRRILSISHQHRKPVHILHISTGEEPVLIAEAKAHGDDVTAEVTPQHLWFAGPECYEKLGSLAQMNPPIRSKSHRERLWRALADGIFDVFGSDHAPHTLEEKSRPYPTSPSGMPGVQTMLPVLLTFVSQGKLSIETVVSMACEQPARIYGIAGKGRLEVGCDADITLVDCARRYTFERSMVESKCGWSPYEGEEFVGAVEHVMIAGAVAVREASRICQPMGKALTFA